MQNIERQDVYTRITGQIISSLEQGVRPWMKPWDAEHAAGRITRPLRHNGQPYSGINILMLWASALEQGFAAPVWMTFKQALELKAVSGTRRGSPLTLTGPAQRTAALLGNFGLMPPGGTPVPVGGQSPKKPNGNVN